MSKIVVFAALACVILAYGCCASRVAGGAAPTRAELEAWTAFKAQYGRTFASRAEERERFLHFVKSHRFVAAHNSNPNAKFSVAINKFADQAAPRNLYKSQSIKSSSSCPSLPNSSPSSWDWRSLGAVTPVVDQGECGASSAYAVAAVLEGQYFNLSGDLTVLSVPELAVCADQSQGCSGDNGTANIFNWLTTHTLSPASACQPKAPSACSSCVKSGVITSGGTCDVSGNEVRMAAAVALTPIAVSVNAGLQSFEMYSGGVYNPGSACTATQLDHSLAVVGFGSTGGVPFWICKNSWGTDWGMSGYILIQRGSNTCGIAQNALFSLGELVSEN